MLVSAVLIVRQFEIALASKSRNRGFRNCSCFLNYLQEQLQTDILCKLQTQYTMLEFLMREKSVTPWAVTLSINTTIAVYLT